MLMMVETVGMSMLKLSSGPIESAWALLKASRVELDEHKLSQITQQMPEELKRQAEGISQVLQQMDPERAKALEIHSRGLLQSHGFGKANPTMRKHSTTSSIISEGRISKLVPLIAIGAVFAIDAVLRSQGQKQSFIGATFKELGHAAGVPGVERPNWGDTVKFEDEARVIDPLIGGEWATIEDPTWYERLGTGALAATSIVNPFAWSRGVGAATKVGTRAVARGAGGASKLATQRGAAQRMGGKLPDMPGVKGGVKQTWRTNLADKGQLVRPQGMTDDVWNAMSPAAKRGFSLSPSGGITQPGTFADDAFRSAGALPVGRKWGRAMTGRFAQGLGSAGVPEALLGAGAAYFANQTPNVQPHTSGFSSPYGSPSGGFTGANVSGTSGGYALDSHIGGVQNVHSVGPGDKSIWQHAASGQGTWHGGAATAKGDNMKIGERMLKDVTELMHKAATCPCGKTPCICKEYKSKGDDKKKPAHGMVIVIGTKAGPGPSTDGKRDKLDSEKDKKDE